MYSTSLCTNLQKVNRVFLVCFVYDTIIRKTFDTRTNTNTCYIEPASFWQTLNQQHRLLNSIWNVKNDVKVIFSIFKIFSYLHTCPAILSFTFLLNTKNKRHIPKRYCIPFHLHSMDFEQSMKILTLGLPPTEETDMSG